MLGFILIKFNQRMVCYSHAVPKFLALVNSSLPHPDQCLETVPISSPSKVRTFKSEYFVLNNDILI